MSRIKRIDLNLNLQSKTKRTSMPTQSDEQLQQILQLVSEKNVSLANCLNMQTLTGLRYSDCSSLVFSDFIVNGAFVSSFVVVQQKVYGMVYSRLVSKGIDEKTAHQKAISKAKTTVYVTDKIKRLVRYCQSISTNEYLFSNKHKKSEGLPVTLKTADYHLKNVEKKLGLSYPLGTHSFRKTFAMNLINKNANIGQVRDLLGHNTITSTNSYISSFASENEALVNLL